MARASVIVGKSPRVVIKISTRYTATQRRAIARDIISYIVTRTRRGLGFDGRPWSGRAAHYSEEYAKSLEFRIGGKSRGNVNLTLSSEMLDSLEEKRQSVGNITIGVGEGQEAKAEGNIKGTYGQKSPIKGKARNFLRLSRRELSAILLAYPKTKREQEEQEEELTNEQVSDSRINDIIEGFLQDESE